MIDSETALDALIKGYSRSEDVALIVTAFWEIVAKHQVNVYLDRVPTDSNISDGVSRSKIVEARSLGWEITAPDPQSVVGRNSDLKKDLGMSQRRLEPAKARDPAPEAKRRRTKDPAPGKDELGPSRPVTTDRPYTPKGS